MAWGRPRSRTLVVTGATGLLGRHLQIAVGSERWEIVAPGSNSLDVRRRDDVRAAVRDWRPAAVVHLAYRRNDRSTIVDGSRHVAEAATSVSARLVHVSTDVVFGGRPEPYTEHDAPTPVDDYGRWKTEAETAVMTADPGAVMVRTSLLLATTTANAVVADVERALSGAGPTFYTDEVRCPAHAADVAAALARLAALPEVTGPLHVAGPQPLSRAELAGAVARWMGADPARLDTGLRPPGRPGHVVLDCTRASTLGIACRPLEEWLRR